MKRTQTIFLIRCSIIMLAFACNARSKASERMASQLRFTQHNEQFGLSSNNVRDIFQSDDQIVWFATNTGLNRFDIFRNEVYQHGKSANTLSSNDLTALAPGLNGTIWVGTANAGLNQFDPKTKEVERYFAGISSEKLNYSGKLPSNHISQLAVSQQNYLWIGTDKGLAVMNLQSKNIRSVNGPLSNSPITSIKVVNSADVWVGTEKGEVFRWNPNKSEFEQILQLGAPITAIGMDARLRIWVGTSGAGLYRSDGDSNYIRTYNQLRDITSITSDELGDLWIGTKQGLARIDKRAKNIRIYHSKKGEPHSLGSNNITKTYFDEFRSMIWITTKDGGISRTSLDQYLFPLVRNGENGIKLPSNAIYSMVPTDDNKVWIGTERGVFLWSNDTASVSLSTSQHQSAPYVISLLEDAQKNLWIGTKGEGLLVQNAKGELLAHFNQTNGSGLGHNYISNLLEDSQGRIWIGTQGAGIFKFVPETQTFAAQQIATTDKVEYIRDIKEDSRGRVWAASRSGLFYIEKNDDQWKPAHQAIPGNNLKSIPEATCMHFSNNHLWIGTNREGLFRINLLNGGLAQFKGSPEDGTLPESAITAIVSDSSGILWIALTNSIARVDPGKIIDSPKRTISERRSQGIRNFDHQDGLQPGNFHRNAFASFKSDDGLTHLLFGGSEGFNIINPSVFPRIIQPPFPTLYDFEYFGKVENPQEGGILEKPLNSTSVLSIPFDKRNRFAFRFANLDYRFPKRGHFRYRLTPYESNWTIASTDNRASYRSVPIGKYTFEVESSVDGHKWTKNSAKILVKITPPWYQTWWFRTILTIVTLAAIFIIGRMILQNRIRSIERREARISAERDKAEVALARQLQQGVLLERTSNGLKKGSSLNEDEIFASPLQYLLEHFEGDMGMIYRVNRNKSDNTDYLTLLADHSKDSSPVPTISFEPNNQLIETVLDSDVAVALEIPEDIEEQLKQSEIEHNINSVLFMSTRFMDRPNGLITIFSQTQPEDWNAEEITIFNSLSQQFGMTIAQLKFAQKERKHRKRLEQEKHEAEIANHAKSDFLAKMTHELRTPLNSIIGFTEILKQDSHLNERQTELINIVNRSGDHLLDVVNDILDLSKIEAGRIEKTESSFETLPLLKSVYEMLKMKADAKHIGFKFVARNDLPDIIHSDRSKIRQTLINLIGNAVKFTDQGEVTLSVDVESIGEPETTDGEVRRKLKLIFEINDTGKGISQEDLPKLFEKYAQTESGLRSGEGTGLGLPIAKSFIQLLGGDIKVESELGKGTTFRFFIECDEIASSNKELASETLTEEQARQINGFITESNDPVRILIAEDQPNNRLLLRKILGRAGFELLEAENGQEAVELNESWRPHLILMDEDMPIKRGSQATKEILEEPDENSPVIVSLTAYALEQAKRAALEAGCKDFLAKPFKTHEIFEVISRHLNLEYTFRDAA